MGYERFVYLIIVVCLLTVMAVSDYGLEKRIDILEQQVANCSCNVSYGGHTMSVEDALERMGEGLSSDQWQEVQVMIDNAMNESAGK